MNIEIWSDVVCPFCYIGKRKLEQALQGFSQKDSVNIVWRSFQLDPDAQPAPGKTQAQVLAEKKGWSLAQTEGMMAQVTEMAAAVGLEFHMEKAVVANTLHAHRLLHLAAQSGKQNEVGERLFRAYFTEGKNVGDPETLMQIGIEAGLEKSQVTDLLSGNAFADAVAQDQQQAANVGARGVPFFVFNAKYAVSGAQPTEVFSQVLQKVWEEENAAPVVEGGFCTPDGVCN